MTELIVALDVDSLREEEELLRRLEGTVTFYKVGFRLFLAHGRRAIEPILRRGGRVFLDLKFLDIPQTVAHAVREANKLGAEAVSLHLWGGARMVAAAAEVSPRPKLWGVTVLTSLSGRELRLLNPGAELKTMVKSLAGMGWAKGLDALICSGHEVRPLRKSLPGMSLRFTVPGIRPADGARQDQRRVITPAQAARLGIDRIVVGRPITAAADPLKAAQKILSEMKTAVPSALERR